MSQDDMYKTEGYREHLKKLRIARVSALIFSALTFLLFRGMQADDILLGQTINIVIPIVFAIVVGLLISHLILCWVEIRGLHKRLDAIDPEPPAGDSI